MTTQHVHMIMGIDAVPYAFSEEVLDLLKAGMKLRFSPFMRPSYYALYNHSELYRYVHSDTEWLLRLRGRLKTIEVRSTSNGNIEEAWYTAAEEPEKI